MEKETKLKLISTYSYARIYKKGDVLKRHKDRFSCEISTTMFLGGDPWSIYLDPTNTELHDATKPYRPIGNKGIKVDTHEYYAELDAKVRNKFPSYKFTKSPYIIIVGQCQEPAQTQQVAEKKITKNIIRNTKIWSNKPARFLTTKL